MLDPDLLEILACPKCKSRVRWTEGVAGQEPRLVCENPACGLRFPVRGGIPVMLIDEADPPPGP